MKRAAASTTRPLHDFRPCRREISCTASQATFASQPPEAAGAEATGCHRYSQKTRQISHQKLPVLTAIMVRTGLRLATHNHALVLMPKQYSVS